MLPTPLNIALDIKKDLTGGRLADISNILDKDVYAKMNTVRALLISKTYYSDKTDKSVSAAWQQKFPLTYDASIQDNPTVYVRFALPTVIDSAFILWQKTNTTQNFAITDVNTINQAMDIPASRPRVDFMQGVMEDGYLLVYGNTALRTGLVKIVAMNPFDVPIYDVRLNKVRNFNAQLDPYPIDPALLRLLKEGVKEELMPREQQVPIGDSWNLLKKQKIES